MNSKHVHDDHIARRLIASADDLAPSYSQSLHQRTMRAIRAQQTRQVVRPAARWNRIIAAAAAVLLIGLCTWHFSGQDAKSLPQTASKGPVIGIDLNIPGAHELLRQGSEPLASVLGVIDGNSFAQLEQNARSLARYLANQFPQSDPRSPGTPNRPAPPPGT